MEEVDLDVRSGEVLGIVGPSGSGKTTLLRLIAGLEMPDSGTIRITGEDMTDRPAYSRPVRTVFQSYALFPHMDVETNVSFGLHRLGPTERHARARATMETLGIAHLAARRPGRLSGGEQQRVALARALVSRPPVLLLDEPLAALDPATREQAQDELQRVARSFGTTLVIVTHDQAEAMALCDRIAMMSRGHILQLGSKEELYLRPASLEVARFFGAANVLPGQVFVREASNVVLLAGAEMTIAQAPATASAGASVSVLVRPGKIRVGVKPAADCGVRGKLVRRQFLGEVDEFQLDLPGGATLHGRRPAGEVRPGPVLGSDVWASWDPNDALVFGEAG